MNCPMCKERETAPNLVYCQPCVDVATRRIGQPLPPEGKCVHRVFEKKGFRRTCKNTEVWRGYCTVHAFQEMLRALVDEQDKHNNTRRMLVSSQELVKQLNQSKWRKIGRAIAKLWKDIWRKEKTA